MTDTLQAPVLPPDPSAPPRRNPARSALTVLAILAVVALGVVTVVATSRNNGTTMMGNNGMPGPMTGNGQMMDGAMMGNGTMGGPMMGHASPSPTIPGAREITVVASAFKFEPADIHVRAGEDVTIVLTATDTTHDFTIDELGFQVAAAPGQVGRGSFHAPSTAVRYTAYCSVAGHRQAGMTATVIVDPA
jgi:heme/copper-type cytochrome/quinol oxidase subunit 2